VSNSSGAQHLCDFYFSDLDFCVVVVNVRRWRVACEPRWIRCATSRTCPLNDRMPYMDAYVLIGEDETGKSSITRSLTGVARGSAANKMSRVIATLTVKIRVYVHLTSLQEDKINPERFAEMVSKQKDCQAVLFSLRLSGARGCPDADTYLQHFIGEGWNIVRVACLDVPVSRITTSLPSGTIRAFPAITDTTTVNEVAAQVRSHFEWI
jgi:hypothetical protein